MLCTSRSGNTLTVTRGQEGTSGTSAASGASVYIPITSASVVRWQLDRKSTAVTASGTTDASQSYCVGVFVKNTNAGHTRINLGQNNGVTGQIVAVHNLGVLSASATAIDQTTVGAATENTTFPTFNGRMDVFRPASLATFICDGANGYLAFGQEELMFDIIGSGHTQYSPRSRAWRSRLTVSSQLRGSARMCGRHVLFGGNVSAATDQYDQATNTTSALTSDSAIRRMTRTGGIVGQYAYVHGGQVSGTDQTTNRSYSYVADAWVTKTSMGQAKSKCTSFVLGDGKVYVSPGTNGTVHEAYTPGADTWTSKTMYTSNAREGTAWAHHMVGVSCGDTSTSPNQGYSPVANAWTTYQAPGAQLTAASGIPNCQIDGLGYVSDYGSGSAVQAFFLKLNTWYAQTSNASGTTTTGIAL